MILESLFIVLLVLIFAVIFYRSAIHEYTIIQKNWVTDDTKWSNLIGERAPLIIREVPWTRFWNHRRTAKYGWPVVLQQGAKRIKSSWSTWLEAKSSGIQKIINTVDLANASGLSEPATQISLAFRRSFWLPGSFAVSGLKANLIPASSDAYVGLIKTTAESTCWVSTDGSPLRVWLAHEGATKGGSWLPPNPIGKNPWNFKPEESPFINDLKFLEIRLRPGNMLMLPPHWWVAFKCDNPTEGNVSEGSWYWTCEFHSAVSYIATKFAP